MTLPNLIIPGAAKSGTTTLHEALAQHSLVFMSAKKEPHVFSYPRSGERMARYEALFEGAEGVPVRGESSTSYMVISEAPVRISAALRDVRLIFILRNPVERIASHYAWLYGKGLEPRPLRRAVLADMNETPDIRNTVLGSGNFYYYFAHSSYGTNLGRFYKVFPRDQILIVTFESLVVDFCSLVAECFAFLGLPEHGVVPIRSNQSRPATRLRASIAYFKRRARKLAPWAWSHVDGKLPVMRGLVAAAERRWGGDPVQGLSEGDRAWLAEQFRDEVDLLRQVTGKRFGEWEADFPI